MKNTDKINGLLKYGIHELLADKIVQYGLSVSTIKATSKLNLKNKYSLSNIEVDIIKKAISRKPIEEDVMLNLLLNNDFTCCACKGNKGHTIIIHHINSYETSQDNSYENLAVVCPTCHDLCHSSRQLTLHISKKLLMQFKQTWEAKCRNERGLDSYKSPITIYKARFQNYIDEDVLDYVIQLSIIKDGEIIKGYFDVTYISRGNIFLAGEFEHLDGDVDQDISLYFWEVQWGMRTSEKRHMKASMHYGITNEISWTCKKDIADVVPAQITFKIDN
jgi:hypothetical protein